MPMKDPVHSVVDVLEVKCQELSTRVHALNPTAISDEKRLPSLLDNLADILQGHLHNVECARSVAQCCKENYHLGMETLTLG